MTPPQPRQDLIDIITPSRRGAVWYQRILEEAAKNAQAWMRHHFIVVFDMPDDNEKLKLEAWIEQAREMMPLPRVTVLTAESDNLHNPNRLRQQGVARGENPFLYFQDDDDALPLNLEPRMRYMLEEGVEAVFGVTETVNIRAQTVEQFPLLLSSGGGVRVDALKAQRWFPTYGHPFAALFTRRLLNFIPLDDGNVYHFPNGCPFNVRLMHSAIKIAFMPNLVRRVRLHDDNDRGIIEREDAVRLAEDIRLWVSYVEEAEIRAFHHEVAEALENGWISTFREIAAMVDTNMGL